MCSLEEGSSSDVVIRVERNGVVVSVEVGAVLAEEDITDDDVMESSGDGSGHDTHEALSLAELRDLDNVVVSGERVGNLVEGEGDVGEVLDVGAVLGNGDAFNEGVNDLFGSDNEGSSRVDGAHKSGGSNGGLSSLLERGDGDIPVGLLNNVMLALESVSSVEFAGNGHNALLGVALEVESERLVGNISSVNEGGELVSRDSIVTKSDDSVHLGDVESSSGNFVHGSEAHSLGSDVAANTGSVHIDGSLNATGSVLDVHGLTVSNVSGRLGGVVGLVSSARNALASGGVNPKVG